MKSQAFIRMRDQVQVCVNAYVMAFSELQQSVDKLVKKDHPMGVLDRLRWMWKEQTIDRLHNQLQWENGAMTLTLALLNW